MSLLLLFHTNSAPTGNPQAFVDLTTAWTNHYLTEMASKGGQDTTTVVAQDITTNYHPQNSADLNSGAAAYFVTNG